MTLLEADRNCVLVPTDWRSRSTPLPLVELPHDWLEDGLRELLEARFGEKGFRKGLPNPNKGRKFDDYDVVTDEEIQRICAAFDMRRVCSRRDVALITFLRGTGLRISEALSFLPTDLNVEKGIVLVQHGKGSKGKGPKRARCGITPYALAQTLEWMDDRKAQGFTDDQPLFCVVEGPTKGQRTNATCIRGSFRTAALRAGVEKRFNPHSLRHALALDMARRNIPLPVISRQLRHSNVATTSTYLQKMSDDEVYEALAGLDWA